MLRMNDLEHRLRRCFHAVFPALSDSVISTVSVEGVSQWDSVAHVTLLEVIHEEFGVLAAEDDAEQLTSFPAWMDYLRQRGQ